MAHPTTETLRRVSPSLREMVVLAVVFGVMAFVLQLDVWWKVWVLAITGGIIYTAGKLVSAD